MCQKNFILEVLNLLNIFGTVIFVNWSNLDISMPVAINFQERAITPIVNR